MVAGAGCRVGLMALASRKPAKRCVQFACRTRLPCSCGLGDVGSRTRTRTSIDGFKVRCPTVRRCGNMDGADCEDRNRLSGLEGPILPEEPAICSGRAGRYPGFGSAPAARALPPVARELVYPDRPRGASQALPYLSEPRQCVPVAGFSRRPSHALLLSAPPS